MPLIDVKRWLAYWNAPITWDEALPSLKKRPDPETLELSPTIRRYELYVYQIAYVFLINGLLITCITTLVWPLLIGLGADLVLLVLQLRNVLLWKPQPQIIARKRIVQVITLGVMGMITIAAFAIILKQGLTIHF
ncbi:MAG TPA: hypothetical protein VKY19_02355 [Ktedonosporobacter sp.]|jgi:hypothetical protein|nr:hypothetical protein [Ktedonosporobacter sp.]